MASPETFNSLDARLEPANQGPLLLDVHGVAAALSVGVRTVWRLAATGDLPAIKLAGATRWRRADLEAFVNELR